MGRFEIGTSNPYTFLVVDTTESVNGTWPNLVPHVHASYKLRVNGWAYWQSNGTTLTLHNSSNTINLNVNLPSGGYSGEIGTVDVDIWWSGNNASITHTPGVSINAPGCFSGSGNITVSFSVGGLTNYDSTAATNITATSATFTYNFYPNNNRYYYCKFKDMKSGKIFTPSSEITYAKGTLYTLTGLNPDTDYEIAVIGYDRNGNISHTSGENYRTKFRTLKASYPPTVPSGLKASNVTSRSANITWGAVENADSYELSVNSDTYETDSTSVTLSLRPNTSYTLKVRAKNGDGTSAWSSTISFSSPKEPFTAYIKQNGTWKIGYIYYKQNGKWTDNITVFSKQNGSWDEIIKEVKK